jgi:protein gp37
VRVRWPKLQFVEQLMSAVVESLEPVTDEIQSCHGRNDAMKNSTIEWTHHTFNPWIGCTKVNALCANCYAELLMDTRYGRVIWGPRGTRVRTTAQYWRQAIRWNKDADHLGERRRVFCASLADVFEDWTELSPWRRDLFALIDRTTGLDWLLLSKRPENIDKMWMGPRDDGYPPSLRRDHVWLGTSVGTQETADLAVPRLLESRHRVPVLFLSVEPLLGPIPRLPLDGIDWVIVGGESGPRARPMEEEWVLEVKQQCDDAGVPFFFKQWGGVNKKQFGRELLGRTWDAIPILSLETVLRSA